MPGTLIVDRDYPHTGIWLCAQTESDVVPIARFVSEEAVAQFHELFALAKAVSFAQGQLGF